MATLVAETCRWPPCNKIKFLNPSALVSLLNKFHASILFAAIAETNILGAIFVLLHRAF